MHSKTYRVGIGMPVYNGEKYLHQAIDSVLSQTFTDFELIISDNASTDSTSSICKEYEKKDQRIRYIRHESNRGPGFNFPFVLSEAKSDYFVWLSYDDYWEPTFLEKNVRILDDINNVVGSIGLVEFFDVGNRSKKNWVIKLKNRIRYKEVNTEKYEHVHPAFGDYEKKAQLYLRFNQGSFVYGVFRTEKLKKRWVPGNIASWDLVLILNILKEGDLHVVDEVLMCRFPSGINSKSGLVSNYKKKLLPFMDLILPYSSLWMWCIRNISVKFFLKNIDWFVLLTVYGWRSILLEIKDSGK